jgi:NadR type nicotinamide-nucleotide adenylyltransferase
MEAFTDSDILTRVVVTGSESTGKTTLATQLAEHYGAELVPEFVRGYAERKNRPLSFRDHGPIAHGQMALEDRHAAVATHLLIQDTDLLSTVVYCNHYFGKCPEWIVSAAAARRPHLYLLMDIDVPWVADGIRDRGHRRAEMHGLFREAVADSGAFVAVIGGNWGDRFAQATAAVDQVLRDRLSP